MLYLFVSFYFVYSGVIIRALVFVLVVDSCVWFGYFTLGLCGELLFQWVWDFVFASWIDLGLRVLGVVLVGVSFTCVWVGW